MATKTFTEEVANITQPETFNNGIAWRVALGSMNLSTPLLTKGRKILSPVHLTDSQKERAKKIAQKHGLAE